MKVLFITAGAAGMYCGSCLRDNALAAELSARGHDVRLVPLYTPTRTDEPNVSQGRVFFGGISVYLQQHYAVFRSTPRFLDRLWDSRPALHLASHGSIPVDPAMLGELTISVLRGEDGHQRKEIHKLVDWLTTQPTPDAVVLPNSLLIGLARPIGQALGVPVWCTLQGEDLFLDGLSDRHRGEALELIRREVAHVCGFLAVSEYYTRFMADYLRIDPDTIHLVPLGINLDGYPAEPSEAGSHDRFTIGYLARIAPEKGLHVLCEAYRRLRASGVTGTRLEAAGYLAPEHRSYLDGLTRKMNDWGLGEEFHYRGELDRAAKIRFLRSLDTLSVPSPHDEPKGLFLLEAMACGVPIVQPRRGAYPEIVERTSGGLLVDPERPEALVEALAELVQHPGRAAELGTQGARGVREHYSVARMADQAMEVFQKVAAAPHAAAAAADTEPQPDRTRIAACWTSAGFQSSIRRPVDRFES